LVHRKTRPSADEELASGRQDLRLYDSTCRGCWFTLELIAGPGAGDRPAYEDLGSSLKLAGLHHVGLRVSSVDAAVNELKTRGVTIVSEPHDPWGNLFELIEAMDRGFTPLGD
jgi:catechol 2,3-dioxygenase-like lactoylglutathione lyase family enzyme